MKTWADIAYQLRLINRSSDLSYKSPKEWNKWASSKIVQFKLKGRSYSRTTGELDLTLKHLSHLFSGLYQAPDYVYGFVSGKSTRDMVVNHLGARNALALDLEKFFDQIDEERIRGALAGVLDSSSLDFVVGVCMVDGKLPAGFRTSPILSNIIFNDTDKKIFNWATRQNVIYTRWADDLVFSGSKIGNDELKEILDILQEFNWAPNKEKIRFMNHDRMILGLNVQENLERPHIPRSLKRGLRQQLYHLRTKQAKHFQDPNSWAPATLLGRISYVECIDSDLGRGFRQELAEITMDDEMKRIFNSSRTGSWQRDLLDHMGFS